MKAELQPKGQIVSDAALVDGPEAGTDWDAGVLCENSFLDRDDGGARREAGIKPHVVDAGPRPTGALQGVRERSTVPTRPRGVEIAGDTQHGDDVVHRRLEAVAGPRRLNLCASRRRVVFGVDGVEVASDDMGAKALDALKERPQLRAAHGLMPIIEMHADDADARVSHIDDDGVAGLAAGHHQGQRLRQ